MRLPFYHELFLLLILQSFWLTTPAQTPSPSDMVLVDSVVLVGNKVTRDNIILRELEFTHGHRYPMEELDSLIVKSRQNLMNRSLFNFVTITKNVSGATCRIQVSVVERWYIWPIPIFQFADRNLNAWLQKGDLNRLNYGIDLRIENFRGRMERLNIIVQTGYDMRLAFRWTIPYLNAKQVSGLVVAGGMQYNHEVAFETVDNKQLYYHSAVNYARKFFFGTFNYTLRPGFNDLHNFGAGFYQYQFQDTLLKLNPDFSCGTVCRYFQLDYTFKLDFRDYKPYPLDGYYFDAQVLKMGLGIFNDGVDLLWVGASFDQYVPLYKRWYFAYNFSARLSGDRDRPYFVSAGLGYNDLDVRGYELYVVDGQNYSVFKSNLKFEIFPQKTVQIPWIKSPKFSEVFFALYANLFFDMGYVSDIYHGAVNPLSNQVLWGTGVGIDFVTYYDVVIRVEMAINRQRKTGVFINFVAPI
jgi:outer membrane protein assembly factor BamA